MSTRSNIIVKLADGRFHSVYCHYDGYLSGVGQTLIDHYNSQALAESLVAGGDISALKQFCTGGPGHTFDHPLPEQTTYYGRDRHEPNTEGRDGANLAEVWPGKDAWAEYVYVWQDGAWSVAELPGDHGGLRLLEGAVKEAEGKPTGAMVEIVLIGFPPRA